MPKTRLLLTAAAAGLVFSSGCAVNPVSGKRELVLVSENQEVAMGAASDPAVVAQFGLYPDKKIQAFIDRKGQQMAKVSHRSDLPFTFRVVDSPVINAFALPGGYVYFTRGILAHFNNEAQFAGVLGHEIGHVTARHSVQQQTKSILGQVGLMGAMILSPRVAQFGEQAMQGLQLLTLKFGRDAERQADELGVEYSSHIGYDANQMADFFQTLARQRDQGGGEAIPDFLSTHPNPDDRYATVHQLAAKWQNNHTAPKWAVNRDEYLRLIDGMTYGEDPRQGFVEGNAFYHPELKFQLPVPNGWKSQNSPQQFQMAEPGGKALMMLLTAPGNTPEEAAQAILKQMSLQPADPRKLTINGFPAIAFTADQVQQDPQTGQQVAGVRVLGHVIQDGKTLYALLGVAAPADFAAFAPQFSSIAQGFQRLSDRDKLNRQAERIAIKKLKYRSNLSKALTDNGIPQKRLEEMAILNGMQLNEQVNAGSLIKVVK